MTAHDHPPDGDCQPSCPAWAEGVLELCALLRRHDRMLAACRAAEQIEFAVVAPATAGVQLPEFLMGEELVRLNLVAGRDCPEVLLDEGGIRATLTFRGRRHDCVLPWRAVKAGVLAAPRRKVRRFGVVAGGDPTATATPTSTPAPAPAPAATPAAPTPTPRPAVAFGLIQGGRKD